MRCMVMNGGAYGFKVLKTQNGGGTEERAEGEKNSDVKATFGVV